VDKSSLSKKEPPQYEPHICCICIADADSHCLFVCFAFVRDAFILLLLINLILLRGHSGANVQGFVAPKCHRYLPFWISGFCFCFICIKLLWTCAGREYGRSRSEIASRLSHYCWASDSHFTWLLSCSASIPASHPRSRGSGDRTEDPKAAATPSPTRCPLLHRCQCAAHNSSSKLITHQGLWRLSFKTRPELGSYLTLGYSNCQLQAPRSSSKWLLLIAGGTLNVAGRWGSGQ